MSERDDCPECGVEIHPMNTADWVLHDGDGHYYMGKGCANCGMVGMRIYPSDGAEIRERFRENARLDPDPPVEVPNDTPQYA